MKWSVAGCALAAIVAICEVLLITPHGINTTPDSSLYIGAANSLREAGRIWMPFGPSGPAPLIHFPPAYPLLLTAGGFLFGSPMVFARVLAALLFAINVGLVAALMQRFAPDSRVAPVIAALLAALGLDLVYVHGMAWSEPLYIALASGSLLMLAHWDVQRSRRLLIAAAALAGGAWLTRYAGAALVGTATIAILFAGRGARQRTRDALLFLGIAAAPMALWLLRNLLVAEQAVNRGIAVHWLEPARAAEALTTAADWFLPAQVGARPWIALLVASSAAALTIATIRRLAREHSGVGGTGEHPGNPVTSQKSGGRDSAERLHGTARAPDQSSIERGQCAPLMPALLGTYLLSYAALLAISISFVDASTPLDARILAPALAVLIPLLVCIGVDLYRRANSRLMRPTIALVTALLLLHSAVRTTTWIRSNGLDGQVYAHDVWRNSPLLAAVRSLEPNARVHTNLPEAVYLIAGRESVMLPSQWSPLSRKQNPRLSSQLQAIGAGKNPAFIAYFDGIGRSHIVAEEALTRAHRLELMTAVRDGRLYRLVR